MANSVIPVITDSLTNMGIKNSFVQQGIVGVIGTESNYVPKSEIGYGNTPNDRIRQIFGSKVSKYSEGQLSALKANNVAFFDVIYGGQYGNTSVGDGWKYRGRGFNGLTFKNQYQIYGNMIGIDLVSNPDLLNQPDIAAKVSAAYFANTLATAKANGTLQSKFGISDLNQVKDTETGTKIALQANAGFGKDLNTTFYQSVFQKALSFATQNPIKAAGLGIGVLIIGTALTFFFLNAISHDK